MINDKMRKRLDWIKPTDKVQGEWLLKHLKKKGIFDPHAPIQGDPFLGASNMKYFINEFIDVAEKWPENLETKSTCRLMREAWSQEKKRSKPTHKNGSFTISNKAFAELKYWAKIDEVSQSKVIENVLLKMRNIRNLDVKITKLEKQASSEYETKRLNKSLKKTANELLKDDESTYNEKQEPECNLENTTEPESTLDTKHSGAAKNTSLQTPKESMEEYKRKKKEENASNKQ